MNRLWEEPHLNAGSRQRLLVIRTARLGNNSYEDIAEITGLSRRTVARCFTRFEEGGWDGLLERGKPKPPPTPMREEALQREFTAELLAGHFRTAKQANKWLKEKHGIKRSVWSVYYWLKEFGATLLVPRPVHIKKDQQKTDLFPEQLDHKLASLPLEKGRPVRIWVQDEGRIGLHTIVRRAWGLSGHRIVVPNQKKYEWGYVYAALEIGTGKFQSLVQSNVTLDTSLEFLKYLAESDPEAEHIVIWDGAGFHQKEGKHALPDRVHVIQLPPYSPELNPTEKLWDVMKDELCNRLFGTFNELEKAVYAALQPFQDSAARVLQLLGNSATIASANGSFLANSAIMNYKWSQKALPDILDLGTGSGILALAARKMGAAQIMGIDFEADSIRICIENETINFTEAKISWLQADLKNWESERKWPLIVANLYSDLLIELAPKLKAWLAEDGDLWLSGILKTQTRSVERAFRKLEFITISRNEKGKWVMLCLARSTTGR